LTSAARDALQSRSNKRSFWKCINDNFLTEAIEEAKRGDALLDLRLIYKKGQVRSKKMKGRFGCSDHKVMEFRMLREDNQTKRKMTTLYFR